MRGAASRAQRHVHVRRRRDVAKHAERRAVWRVRGGDLQACAGVPRVQRVSSANDELRRRHRGGRLPLRAGVPQCVGGLCGLRGGPYKEFIGNNSCVACPANANTSGVASNALENCLCLPGYRESAGSDEACAPCPRDTFTDELGASSCSTCPLYSGTASQASTSASCMCLAGYEPNGAHSACTACAAGTYKTALSMDPCTRCPDNMFSLSGATALANCTCNAGYEKTGASACALCAADAYCPGADAKLACPGNSSAPRGVATIDACVCLPGFYWYYAACELCSEDHFCANNTRSACPPNSTASVASVSMDNCTCLPGFH